MGWDEDRGRDESGVRNGRGEVGWVNIESRRGREGLEQEVGLV